MAQQKGCKPTPALYRAEKYITPEPNTGCWLWDGATNAQGYAVLSEAGKIVRVHRLMYEALKQKIPYGKQLDHVCRVRCCVNPDHLDPVTNRENARRGDVGKHNAVKTSCPRGHMYTSENTYINPRGSRECKTCRDARIAKFKHERNHHDAA